MARPHPASRVTAALVCALMVAASLAPGVAGQNVELGLKLGGASTTVSWEPSPLGGMLEEVERRTSFTAGVSAGLRFSSGLGLRAEVLRVEKGFREVQANGDRSTLDVGYLEVPVLAAVTFGRGGPVQPELYAGPYLARELSCDVEGEVGTSMVSFDCDEIPGDPVLRHTTDWGAMAGAALRIGNAGRVRGVLDLRYTHGLRNVDASSQVDNLNTRHRSLAAMVGFAIRVGPRLGR